MLDWPLEFPAPNGAFLDAVIKREDIQIFRKEALIC